MPGKVYCFNCYNEPMNQLNVNGMSAGGVRGWSSSGPTIYTPSAVPVPRGRGRGGSVTGGRSWSGGSFGGREDSSDEAPKGSKPSD